jgi:cysteine desulfurase / selenocysteine lyase
MIYFDNAATSWPKPNDVLEAMKNFALNVGANAGRSGHRMAVESEQIRYETREVLATLFNIKDPLRIIFTLNATEALNLVFNGLLKSGDHVVTTSMEHNSVMRPLNAIKEKSISVSVVNCETDGAIQVNKIEEAILPETRLVVVNHASNVCGTILPLFEIGETVKNSNALFCVDAAQTAGSIPINVKKNNIDFLAFTGHKSLLGPSGTGGLVIGENVNIDELRPLTFGGTGSLSEQHLQPESLPDKYESGTCNMIGIAGLGASVKWILEKGLDKIHFQENKLTQQLIKGLTSIPKIKVYGTKDSSKQTSTISFNIEGKSPSEVGLCLDEEFEIMCRVGLHCSPSAHQTLGTFPDGTVRFALGIFNTEDEIKIALTALEKIAKRKN